MEADRSGVQPKTWERDAEVAGSVERNSKAYIAMLIARCVQPGEGQGRRNFSQNREKCSLVAFAKRAGMSDHTVAAYLRTWEALAAAGIVPAPADMTPGADVPLPTPEQWVTHYRAANTPPPPPSPSLSPPKSPPRRERPSCTECGDTVAVGRLFKGDLCEDCFVAENPDPVVTLKPQIRTTDACVAGQLRTWVRDVIDGMNRLSESDLTEAERAAVGDAVNRLGDALYLSPGVKVP